MNTLLPRALHCCCRRLAADNMMARCVQALTAAAAALLHATATITASFRLEQLPLALSLALLIACTRVFGELVTI